MASFFSTNKYPCGLELAKEIRTGIGVAATISMSSKAIDTKIGRFGFCWRVSGFVELLIVWPEFFLVLWSGAGVAQNYWGLGPLGPSGVLRGGAP